MILWASEFECPHGVSLVEPPVLLAEELGVRLELGRKEQPGHATHTLVRDEGPNDRVCPARVNDHIIVKERHDLERGGPEPLLRARDVPAWSFRR